MGGGGGANAGDGEGCVISRASAGSEVSFDINKTSNLMRMKQNGETDSLEPHVP